jgi:uncharacterized protein YcfJ
MITLKQRGKTMNKIIPIVLAGFMLTGCLATTQETKRQSIVLGGCLSGGIAGSNVGSGSGKTLATITGVLAGCKLGEEVAKRTVDKNSK